jgi:hypothetical protein
MKRRNLLLSLGSAMLLSGLVNAQSKLTIVNGSWGYFSNPAITAESNATGGWALTEGIVTTGRGGFDNYGIRARAVGGTNYNVGALGFADSAAVTGIGVFGRSLFAGSSNYGVYGQAAGGIAQNWAGYFVGSVYTTGTYQPSDQRLKRDVKTEESVMKKIMQLRPVSYEYKADEMKHMQLPDVRQHGFIAQELQKVFPEAVKDVQQPVFENDKIVRTEEFSAINYQALIPVLFKAIQEQQVMIEDLKKQLNEINGKKITKNELKGAYLAEAAPNPANTSTTIRYRLPDNVQKASIEIYDVAGNKVLQFNNLKGNSQVVVNSAQLATGTYVYSLRVAGKEMLSSKFVVSRG